MYWERAMTNFFVSHLVRLYFPGKFESKWFILTFSPKSPFWFSGTNQFYKTLLYCHLSRLRCPAFPLWNQLALCGRRTEGWLKSGLCQKPRSPCSFWSLLSLHFTGLPFFGTITHILLDSKPSRNPRTKASSTVKEKL